MSKEQPKGVLKDSWICGSERSRAYNFNGAVAFLMNR